MTTFDVISYNMENQLFINGVDAYTTYGVTMGNDFLSVLDAPNELKEYITNEVRGEHGKRVVSVINNYVASRELNLSFIIQGNTVELFTENRNAFINLLESGFVIKVHVPALGNQIYRLLYKSSVSWARSINGCSAILSAKFDEPNPKNRTND